MVSGLLHKIAILNFKNTWKEGWIMFCSNCGKEIANEASFCSFCGGKVKNEILEHREVSTNRNTVSSDKMKNLGITKSSFSKRVESVDDPEANALLFTLFEKLIEPVKEIEKCVELINEDEEILQSHVVVEKFHYPIFVKVLLIIVGIIVSILLIFPTALIYELTGSLGYAGWVYIYCAVLLIGLVCCIPNIIKYKKASSVHEEKKALALPDIENMKSRALKITENISEYMQFVPPKYRTSEALAYFCESYMNTRVSNLAEAINAYDQFYAAEKRHRETVDMLQGIQYKMDSLENDMELMNAQLLVMDSQILGMRSDMWWYTH